MCVHKQPRGFQSDLSLWNEKEINSKCKKGKWERKRKHITKMEDLLVMLLHLSLLCVRVPLCSLFYLKVSFPFPPGVVLLVFQMTVYEIYNMPKLWYNIEENRTVAFCQWETRSMCVCVSVSVSVCACVCEQEHPTQMSVWNQQNRGNIIICV